ENNKISARKMVEPIGHSCSHLKHRIKDTTILLADEADASVIRSDEDLEVTDLKNYNCKVEGVDKVTGACKIWLPDSTKPIIGKISDPQLHNRGNVYTRALDQGGEIIIKAKATLKEGKIHRLFISDAEKVR
ncbi:MAG: hypothetical protein IT560_12050, partial [Alphaproteobacteria bacterium]|nr:hypothetical protein [Alphaproteobacteria bacterium]